MLLNLNAVDTNLLTDHTLGPMFENESLCRPGMLFFAWLEEGDTGGGTVTPALGQDHTQTAQRDLFISEASTEKGFCDLQK